MKNEIVEHRRKFFSLYESIEVTDQRPKTLSLDEGLEHAINMIIAQTNAGGKLIFIGNGGSAAIASHMAIDFWKNIGVKAVTFNEAAALTCLSNDIGYKHVFEKSVNMFAEEKDILVAISSSGKSENILRGVDAAREKGVRVITLSGFGEENPLRQKGEINFYVPESHYGYVEVLHHCLCHAMVDIVLDNKVKLNEGVETSERI